MKRTATNTNVTDNPYWKTIKDLNLVAGSEAEPYTGGSGIPDSALEAILNRESQITPTAQALEKEKNIEKTVEIIDKYLSN